MGPDGAVAAGAWRDGAYVRTSDLLAEGVAGPPPRESTTLVAVLTDAAMTKTQAWLVARAATGGVSRAVQPSATAVDGDVVYVMATGRVPADPFAVSALAADVSAAAIQRCRRAGDRRTGVPRRGHSTSRRSTAQRLSSWRFESWSLRSTALTCASTVLAEMPSSSAISL